MQSKFHSWLAPLAAVSTTLALASAAPAPSAFQDVGPLAEKQGGGFYLADHHQRGRASSVAIAHVYYGRLVDVHGLDASGAVAPTPVLRDLVIHPGVASDGTDYRLEEHPVTQAARLIILRPFTGAAGKGDPFYDLLAATQVGLPELASEGEGEASGFAAVPRNAALVVQLDDLLSDGALAALQLHEAVRVKTGVPPSAPFQARIFFDASHGGVAGGGSVPAFHTTRVIADLSVSAVEAAQHAVPLAVQPAGLPAGLEGSTAANALLCISTQAGAAVAELALLRNLSGSPVTSAGGPFDPASLDAVRAMRTGHAGELHQGFLPDLRAPSILGQWTASIDVAAGDPEGAAGFDFVVELAFHSPCARAPAPGHVLEAPGLLLEVTADAPAPDAAGKVHRVHVRSLAARATAPEALLGAASYVSPYAAGVLDAELDVCWLTLSPPPGALPATLVQPASQVALRFSEPMDPATVAPYDTFALARGIGEPTAHDLVPAEVQASTDLFTFTSTPLFPLSHVQGTAEAYHVWLGGARATFTDLAGNPVAEKPRHAALTLDPSAATDRNGGVVLRFSELDEIKVPAAADGATDVRGQVLVDLQAGVLRPRPVTRFSAVADRTQAVPGLMTPFPAGVQTPLSPLGSKLMSAWRYTDVGMSATDESTHNVDVEGLAWSPIGGAVAADVFPGFEMRLSHGHFLPDEHLSPSGLPQFPGSGLTATTFEANVLVDPASPQAIVHAKELGYAIDPALLFTATTGTPMMPWPLNQSGGPYASYLWRDTAVQALAGPDGSGIDQSIMEDAGLIPRGTAGQLAPAGEVPSIGLPLLMEVRCHPSDSALGFNSLDVSLAVNSSSRPSFRIFSTGGLDATGNPVVVDPDLELSPSGGFAPGSQPPGQPTAPDDNAFYIGQMDLVTRVSRAHTVWIDTGVDDGSATFLQAMLLPPAEDLLAGTEVTVAWRGATAIGAPSARGPAFDAAEIDPYGELRAPGAYLGSDADVAFLVPGDATWKTDLATLAGARYLQARITFTGNVRTLATAELSSLALAFDFQ